WILFTIVAFGLGIGLQLLPIIGSLAYALIAPALYGGMIYSAAQLDNGHSVEFEDLFVGLARAEHRTPLLILGALSLAANLLLLVVIFAVAGGSALMVAGGGGDAAPAAMLGTMLTVAVIVAVFGALLAMAFVYACPLILLAGVAPIEAVITSFRASLSNLVPMIVVGVILVVAAFFASIPFMLGWLVLIPVTVGAVYASYGDLFGSGVDSSADSDNADAAPPQLEP
ncbi:MAG: hypothetical protein KJO38_08765, partial [Gammaproteobacteria bacterium]|nr:hypothetical protein [Gammaproteobacteria bacterium]